MPRTKKEFTERMSFYGTPEDMAMLDERRKRHKMGRGEYMRHLIRGDVPMTWDEVEKRFADVEKRVERLESVNF